LDDQSERGHAATADAAKKVISKVRHWRNLEGLLMRCNAGHSALRSNICRVGKGARAKVYTIRASLTARGVPTLRRGCEKTVAGG
jgi:hypothetical protein